MEPLTPLEELGRHIAAGQNRRLSSAAVARTKQRLLARSSHRARRAWQWIASGALAATLVLAVLVVWLRRPPPVLGVTLSNGQPLDVGTWVGAQTGETLHFTDGTEVVLEKGSSARIASIDDAGARVVVEHGNVDATVKHRPGARWLFDVGPFTVRVTGTRFRADWDSERSQFTLELIEGSVSVSGPVVGDGRTVTSGQTVHVSVETQRLELGAMRSSQPAPAPTASGPDAPMTPTPSMRPAPPSPSAPSAAPEAAPRSVASKAESATAASELSTDWRELAREGQFKKALVAAKRAGVEEILESGTADDVAQLADVARLASDAVLAKRALSTLRRRFAGDSRAALSAFMLGRIAFDDQRSYAKAAEWFALYLKEQPNGTLAREALGRLMEALHLAGDDEAARSAAQRYLRRYPKGPLADEARSMAGP